MSEQDFTIFADYFQFFLLDEDADDPGVGDYETGLANRVIVQDFGCVVLTARNMDVPVTVVIVPEPPQCNLDEWDHAAEFSIEVPSGRMIIAGCTDYIPDAARLEVPPGTVNLRILFSGLDTLSENGLDGDDRYRVELWPGKARPLEILKRFQ